MRVTIKTQPGVVTITIDELDGPVSVHSCTEAVQATSQEHDEQNAITPQTTATTETQAEPVETPPAKPVETHKTAMEVLENVEDVEKLETLLLAAKDSMTINDAANMYAKKYSRSPRTAIARLKTLRQRGLVNATRHGNNRYLSLTSEGEKLLELIQSNKSETEAEPAETETTAKTETVETETTQTAEQTRAAPSIEELIIEKCSVPRTLSSFVEHAATLTCRTQQEISGVIEKLLEEGRLTRWSSQKIIATTAL